MRSATMIFAVLGLALAALDARAGETIEDEDGILNPQEMTIDYWAGQADAPVFDPKMCLFGYPAAKMGNHPAARKIFERCAEAGVTGAMPWIAWTEENGYDRPSAPGKAAEWDKRLADTGSSLGQFNYGLDLLRGHGVRQDPIRGRAYVDQAAKGGDTDARYLAGHGYDPETVTPDPDKPRYRLPGS
jgi:hypothetical protein